MNIARTRLRPGAPTTTRRFVPAELRPLEPPIAYRSAMESLALIVSLLRGGAMLAAGGSVVLAFLPWRASWIASIVVAGPGALIGGYFLLLPVGIGGRIFGGLLLACSIAGVVLSARRLSQPAT